MPRPLKHSTLGALETAFTEAGSAPLKSQIKRRARALAAEIGQAVPPWAMPAIASLPALPDVLKRWRAAVVGRAIERDRSGCVVLVEKHRRAVFSTPEAAADAIIGRTVAWAEPERMFGTPHR